MSTLAGSVWFAEKASAALRARDERVTFNREPWVAGLLSLVGYSIFGAWLASRYGVIGDTLSRVANSYFVLFSRDPHLAAIGFIWNPLPSLLDLPLLLLKDILPSLAQQGLAANLVSALFGGITVYYFVRVLRRLDLSRPLRWMLVLLFAVNPGVAFYASNGMTDLMMAATLLAAIDGLWGYLEETDLRGLLTSGIWLAVGFLIRYETAFWAAVVAVALAFGLARLPAHRLPTRRHRDWISGLIVIWLAPLVFTMTTWLFLNWAIMGDPLFFANSVYGNVAQIGTGGYGDAATAGAAGRIGSSLVYMARHMLIFPPVIVGIAGLLAFGLTGRREPHVRALILVAATIGVPLMQVLMLYRGLSAGWLRFFLTFIPFGFVTVVFAARWLGARYPRWMVWWVCLLALAAGNVATYAAMTSASFLSEKLSRFDGYDPVVAYLDAHREITVLTDSWLSFPIILRVDEPKRLVITSDRDFPLLLEQPAGQVDAFLVPRPGSRGSQDAVNRRYPRLWEGGEPWAVLLQDFPGQDGWRLYAIAGSSTASSVATAVPTASPSSVTPTATVVPTTTPLPTPSPAAIVPPVATAQIVPPTPVPATPAVPSASAQPPVTLQQVAAAEAALRTGWFTATIDDGSGNTSVIHGRFDRGGPQQPSRLELIMTYQSATGPRTIERLLIGHQVWERSPGAQWEPSTSDGMWEQVSILLPRAVAAGSPAVPDNRNGGVLRWYDPERNADVTLEVDPTTRVPQRMHLVLHGNGSVVTVVYHAWNAPIDLAAPSAP